jgi:serine/threonine protein phosphatase 1
VNRSISNGAAFDMPVGLLRKFRKRRAKPYYSVPEGIRVYAIGDVHGCLDELNRVLDAIDRDLGSHRGQSQLVFLGDLVDRGPQSAGVIERIVRGGLPTNTSVAIMGNHEEAMLECYKGVTESYGPWLQYGGVQTLESYGLGREEIFATEFDLGAAMRKTIPAEHARFIASLKDYVQVGDYVFVHAGIQGGVPLGEQTGRDLRWIRRGFLDDTSHHGFMVVHGHTIVPKVEFRKNRIALDTGCYQTGQLSALALESDTVKVVTTGSR